MIFVIIGIIVYTLIAFCTICIMLGGDANKSEFERKQEDEEQIRYLENYKNKKINMEEYKDE